MIPPLQAATGVYLDTAPIICLVEEHPDYLTLVEPLVEAIDRGATLGITSSITLSGVMVGPLIGGRPDLAAPIAISCSAAACASSRSMK